MNKEKHKRYLLQRRHGRVRKKVKGTVERPRLAVFRSLKHFHAQVIDDDRGLTLAAASTHEKAVREALPYGGNKTAAIHLGKLIAERALSKGVTQVVFDRGGYKYHGRVKAFADAAREGKLKF